MGPWWIISAESVAADLSSVIPLYNQFIFKAIQFSEDSESYLLFSCAHFPTLFLRSTSAPSRIAIIREVNRW